MNSLAGRRYVIVGAGIAGLSAAIALRWRGAEPIVIERAPRIEAVGAGIQLTPNAMKAAKRLGVDLCLERAGIKPDALIVRNGMTSRQLISMPTGDALIPKFGAPSVVIRRADLIAALLRTAEALGIEIRTGLTVIDVATHARGATALAENAFGISEAQGALLIAADGVWSSIRTGIFNAAPAEYAGFTAWRAIASAHSLPSVARRSVGLWLGPDAHLVHYPVDGGQRINLVAVMADKWRGEGWSTDGDAAIPRLRFRDWSTSVREMIAVPKKWTCWPIATVDTVMPWIHEDCILLVGDAAHAGLPFAAQGAALAMEDAVELAALLERHAGNQPRALAAFVAARRARAQAVMQQAERNGASYHIAGPFARARDLALLAMGGDRLLKLQAPIYGWTPSPL